MNKKTLKMSSIINELLRYFVVHIFVPGEKEIPKESHLLSKKFEFLNIRKRFL